MKTILQGYVERAKERPRYWVEGAILDFTEEVCERMEHLGISKTELASRLGKKPPFVTKLLRGNNNFTLETMVNLARALNSQVRIHLQPDGTLSEWLDFLHSDPIRNTVPAKVTPWKEAEAGFETILKVPTFVTHEPRPVAA